MKTRHARERLPHSPGVVLVGWVIKADQPAAGVFFGTFVSWVGPRRGAGMSNFVPEFLRQPSRGLHPKSTTNSSGILGWDAEEAKAATAMQAQVRGSQVRSHIHVQASKDRGTRQEWKPSADTESSLQRDRSSPPLRRPSPTSLRPQIPPPGQQSPRTPRSSPAQQPLSGERSPLSPQQLERHGSPFGEAWSSPPKERPSSSPPKQLEPLRSLKPTPTKAARAAAQQTPQPSAPTRRSAGVDGWGVAEQSDLRVKASRSTGG